MREAGANEVIKVKSMTTDEIGLNDALTAAGIAVREIDLAEVIVQLGHDRPSHILVPAIHRNRAEIREIFLLGTSDVDPELTTIHEPWRWPPGDTCVASSSTHKSRCPARTSRLPKAERLMWSSPRVTAGCAWLCPDPDHRHGHPEGPPGLARSGDLPAVAPPLRNGRANEPVHVAMDGRHSGGRAARRPTWCCSTPAAALTDEVGRTALHCIRYSACLNVCPVYVRTGGHAYGSVYPRPIGAVLFLQLTGIADNASPPYASTQCGACYEACSVKIDIPALLVRLRAQHVEHLSAQRRSSGNGRSGMDDV